MRRKRLLLTGLGILLAGAFGVRIYATGPAAGTPYSLDASYIEACSCMLYCPCYTNNRAHHEFCEFNMAVKVNDGRVGDVSLKGARYWLAGDLGNEWGTEGKAPWLVITFDPSVTQAQRDALVQILGKIYPLDWATVQMDESEFSWSIEGNLASAKLANGKGEMVLERFVGADGGKVTLNNIKYFGASKNHGFTFYKSKVHRWDGFDHQFDYSGRNAFTIHLEAEGTL